jgi:hypothetical protein
MNDARLWRPRLCINRVLRVMLHTHWSAEAWSQVRVEFKRALALRSEIRRAEGFNRMTDSTGEWEVWWGGPTPPQAARTLTFASSGWTSPA